jgi:hypothetical protein
MKAVGTLNWDSIRNWLAEAGSACSGYYFDHAEAPKARVELLPRRRCDRSESAGSAADWPDSNREL